LAPLQSQLLKFKPTYRIGFREREVKLVAVNEMFSET